MVGLFYSFLALNDVEKCHYNSLGMTLKNVKNTYICKIWFQPCNYEILYYTYLFMIFLWYAIGEKNMTIKNIGGGMNMVSSCVIDYYCMYHDKCISMNKNT